MKRFLVLTATLLVLAFGAAQAQSWIGLRTGYPLGVTVHYGINNGLSSGLDLRVSANLHVYGKNVNFGVGVDGLHDVYLRRPFTVYVGAGPALDFGGGSALLDIHGLLGGEFRLSEVNLDPLGIFAEVELGAGIGIHRPSVIPTFGGAIGFNYHF